MLTIVKLLWNWLAALLKSRQRLEAEIVVLRHQPNILRRRAPRRIFLSYVDRLAFIWLYRLSPAVVDAVAIIRPETLIRWHRLGFRAFWRWKARSRGGRAALPSDIRELIQEMSRTNFLRERRECVDHVIVLGQSHLRRILSSYVRDYNDARTHMSLDKDARLGRNIMRSGQVIAEPMVGSLHHHYVWI